MRGLFWLKGLKSLLKVGAETMGMHQSRRDCAWSSTSKDGRSEYVKLHLSLDFENLETPIQAFHRKKAVATSIHPMETEVVK